MMPCPLQCNVNPAKIGYLIADYIAPYSRILVLLSAITLLSDDHFLISLPPDTMEHRPQGIHCDPMVSRTYLHLPSFSPLFTDDELQNLFDVVALRRLPSETFVDYRRPALDALYDDDFCMRRLRTPSPRNTLYGGWMYSDDEDTDSDLSSCFGDVSVEHRLYWLNVLISCYVGVGVCPTPAHWRVLD